MVLLSIGVVVFVGIHLLPSAPALRDRAMARLGAQGYRGVFSLFALTGLVLMIVGMSRAPTIPLWSPPSWGFTASVLGMPFAFIFLAAAYAPSNLKRVIRHPMLSGVALWAALHLLSNGDLASLVLFGGLGAFSVFDIVSANRRGAERSRRRLPLWRDLIPLSIGLIAFFLVLHYHQWLFGRAVLPFWQAFWS